jgi:hypothetical protein
MAVDTRHRALREAVGMRSVELSGGIRVTSRALLIHVDRLSRDQLSRSLVDTVALTACHLTFRMSRADAT